MIKNLSSYEIEVAEYFTDKAEGYDDVENQRYWQLSDKLLWDLIKNQLDKHEGGLTILDAGGGTGRWSKKILDNYSNAKVFTVDLSKEMLNQAERKNSFGERWQINRGDIQNLDFESEMFDFVINTHNVLGFVENSQKAITEMSRVLKKDGLLISVVPNKYHAIFFNLFLSNINGANNILRTGRGKFVDNMPEMDMFSSKKMKEMYSNAGLHDSFCWGFPISIYPGYQETQLYGETEQVKNALDNLEEIYELEKKLIKNEEVAARGNNLFVVGKKGY
jgi:ubiquinone/menaquinone biosynthesis C-methylase UbiE